jgi:hypothetical protein
MADVMVVMDDFTPFLFLQLPATQGVFDGAVFCCGMRFSAWHATESGHGVGCTSARALNEVLLLKANARMINATATMGISHFSAAGCGP